MSFLLVAFSTIYFSACKKDDLTSQSVFQSRANQTFTLDVDEAKNWYISQIGTMTSLTDNDESFIISTPDPKWEEVIRGFNETGAEFMTLPIGNSIITANRSGAKLIVHKDSSGQFKGDFIFYVADSLYDIQTNRLYNPETFTGIAIYTDLRGKFKFGQKIVNGQINGSVDAKRQITNPSSSNSAMGALHTRSNCQTYQIPYSVFKIYALKSNSFDKGYWDFETIVVTECDSNLGGGSSGDGRSSGGSSFSGTVPENVFTETERSQMRLRVRALRLNELEDFFVANKPLWNAADKFLKKRGETTRNKNALMNLVFSVIDQDALSEHLALMADDVAYYNTNVQLGFSVNVVNSLSKYKASGFSVAEFGQLMANSSLFQQVDAFLKTNGFTNENRLNVKGFTFLLEADDDFKTLNKNRGNKSIKQLLDEVGYPKINARTMMWLARKNGVTYFKDGKEEINFFRLGRIQEDAVIRSIQGVSKNTKAYQDPLGQRISTIPDIVTEGFTVRSENGIPKEIWSSSECSFLDSKFTATGIIKDNVTTTDQGEIRQQLSTMIDVLANMKGVVYNSLIMPNWKPADHGIATLTIVTIHDAEIDPILVKQAKTKNVRMHKRWLELDLETQKIKVSTNFQLTVNPATNKGWDVPTLRSDAVDFNWSVQ